MLLEKLNNLCYLNIHQNIINNLNVNILFNKFMEKHNLKKQTFAIIY